MTAKEMLLTCDRNAVMAMPERRSEAPQFEDSQMYTRFFQEIAAIEPTPGDYVVLGRFCETGDPEIGELRLYQKSDLLSNDQKAEHYNIDLLPWEQLLGAEIPEENPCACGHDRMAAMMIRHMSTWGLSLAQSRCGQKKFWKNLDTALQEDTCQQTFQTVAEMMAALEDDACR